MYKNLAATRICTGLATACFTFLAQGQSPQTSVAEPLKIGFVYVAPLTDAGWVRQHDEGRKAVEAALNPPTGTPKVRTSYVENVAEGADAERVIRDLANSGHRLIVTPSFGYMEPTLRVAKDFPDVSFESVTGYKTAPNVAVVNARYYEGRYLAGVAAGRLTQSNVAGYVAGFPIPEVLQGINAFTLGMRSVNPKAEVKVIWLNAWFDPPRERDAAITLFNQNVDVIAFHTGSNAVMVAAQERGKMAIAYHSDMRRVAPDAQILAITHEWGAYYTQRANAVLSGQWKSGSVWGGVKEGMVRVDAFGPKVSKAIRDEVLQRQKEIASGSLHPFAAGGLDVKNNLGQTAIPAGTTLNDAQLLGMDWLAAGVQGKLTK